MHIIGRDEIVAQHVADLHRQAAKQRLLRELRASRKPTVHHRRILELLTVRRPRPEVLAGWAQLAGVIRTGMDLRRYELVTLAAARALRSTYCAMAHGRRTPQPSDRPTALPVGQEAS